MLFDRLAVSLDAVKESAHLITYRVDVGRVVGVSEIHLLFSVLCEREFDHECLQASLVFKRNRHWHG